jgi:hypothetical protein
MIVNAVIAMGRSCLLRVPPALLAWNTIAGIRYRISALAAICMCTQVFTTET